MKKYFYTDGTTKYGPFTLEELKEKEISRDTKIWFQELNEWKSAGDVPELSDLFKLVPPPISKTSSKNNMVNLNQERPPKTWLVESILATLFCCLPFGIVGIVNASKVETRFYAGDIKGAQRASADAKKWTIVSFWLAIGLVAIYFILIILGIIGAASVS